MARIANHRHNAGQIVTASGLAVKKRAWLRTDHDHTTDQITGAPSPTNEKEKAQGRQHWHDTSQVS